MLERGVFETLSLLSLAGGIYVIALGVMLWRFGLVGRPRRHVSLSQFRPR